VAVGQIHEAGEGLSPTDTIGRSGFWKPELTPELDLELVSFTVWTSHAGYATECFAEAEKRMLMPVGERPFSDKITV